MFSNDGQKVYFTAISRGAVNLYAVPVSGGIAALIVKGGTMAASAAKGVYLVKVTNRKQQSVYEQKVVVQ